MTTGTDGPTLFGPRASCLPTNNLPSFFVRSLPFQAGFPGRHRRRTCRPIATMHPAAARRCGFILAGLGTGPSDGSGAGGGQTDSLRQVSQSIRQKWRRVTSVEGGGRRGRLEISGGYGRVGHRGGCWPFRREQFSDSSIPPPPLGLPAACLLSSFLSLPRPSAAAAAEAAAEAAADLPALRGSGRRAGRQAGRQAGTLSLLLLSLAPRSAGRTPPPPHPRLRPPFLPLSPPPSRPPPCAPRRRSPPRRPPRAPLRRPAAGRPQSVADQIPSGAGPEPTKSERKEGQGLQAVSE